MKTRWLRFMARRDGWIVAPPRWIRRLEAAVLVSFAALITYPLIAVPPLFVLILTHTAHVTGTGRDSVAVLDPWWRYAALAVTFLMIAASAVVGGYARAAFDQITNRWAALILTGLAGALFAYVGHFVRGASDGLDLGKGDHGLLAAVLVVWLFTVGYVCKVPWDRSRDLWSRYISVLRRRSTGRIRQKAKRRIASRARSTTTDALG